MSPDRLDPQLPSPIKRRWQPLRAGLVDLFYYDYQEFRFRDGHLLLRGNNGTGKSKVLALMLPFLLDGQLAPARVEPDGDPGKRMEWNLLLGGRYGERLGYTWVEFGRLDEAGQVETLTLGCGLKAVHGRGSPRTWFFITDQRIGEDLWLVGQNDLTLSRERLIEAIGNRGTVFDTAARYRRAVDEKLFQLGEERYTALINLLIQLRQPQLSKRPNEQALSAALTEALPPLEQAVLTDVAEAFRNLEADREELEGLREATQAVDQFRGCYRQYAQIAARRRAREVRQAHSSFEKTSAELGDTRSAQEDTRRRQGEVEAQLDSLSARLGGARAAERTLRDSPEMRDANALRQAEESATERTALAAEAGRRQSDAERELQRRETQLQERSEAVARSAEAVRAAAAEVGLQAREAGIEAEHGRLLAPLALPDGDPEAAPDGNDAGIDIAARSAGELHTRRQDAVRHLTRLNGELDRARRALTEARRQLQTEVDQAERLEEDRLQAEQAVTRAGEALIEAYDRFARGTRELRVADADGLTAELAGWAISLSGDNPAQAAWAAAYQRGSQTLAERRADLVREREAVLAERRQLLDEQARLRAGELSRPPPPYTRDGMARADRPGAPLWQLVDFRDGVPATARAGLEAALESAGLLDAWVMPDGSLLAADTWDVVLVAASTVAGNLSAVLVPAVDTANARAAAVGVRVLERLLGSIGLGEAPTSRAAWVSVDGHWQLGPARGAWRKDAAQYIGRGAREAARHKRLTELDAGLAAAGAELSRIDQALQSLRERLQVLEEEWRQVPRDNDLRRAHDRVSYLFEQRHQAQTRIAQAETVVSRAADAMEECAHARDESAGDLRLPTAPEALAAVAEALAEYRAAAGALWPQLRRHWDNRAALTAAGSERDAARLGFEASVEQASEQERAARAAVVHRDTLRETLGAAVAQLEQRLAETDRLIKDLEIEDRQTQKTLVRLAGEVGVLTTRARDLTARLEQDREQRRRAIRALQDFTADGLLAAAVSELGPPERADEWPADPAVRLARRVEQALQEVDDGDGAWDRHQRGLFLHFTTLQNALSRHGHEASAEQTDSGIIVRVVFQSRHCSPDDLARSLQAELRERQALLDARERELLENHLINEVASHLQGMISDAERQVQRMNEELERRPTSIGMKLRFVWRPLEEGPGGGAPVGLAEARKRLLRQVADAWSAQDREAIGQFLQRRIADVRATDEGGTLLEHLEKALDYRRWHRFIVERWQDRQWRPASGPASGGERVLAVTVPLFAAASSHYGSAGACAPRLVMLDEAFAGVDDDSRAKCMGLLAQFDLDFVMTSEREWGCYADLPGLAIAQLARREGIDAVHVSHWSWDGVRREYAVNEAVPMKAPLRAGADVGAEHGDTEEPSGMLF